MTPTSATTLACVAALALLTLGGCERSGAGTVPDQPSPVEKTTTNQPSSKGPEGVGQSCETPKDCHSYLWCYDGACAVPAAVTGEHDASTPKITFVGKGGKEIASFYLELALTAPEHEKGLMFRRDLGKDWGMLFVYPDEEPRSFWMQNTFIPLDMVFIDAHGEVVNIIREAAPLTRVRRNSEGPARYVLELAGGRAAEVGLHHGQHIELANIADEHKPAQ